MNDEERDHIVREYIRQAMAIQNGNDNDSPDLKGIARELGMTDAEITAVDRSATEHLERGSGYCHHKQWDDAISELTVASALAPTSVPTLYELAAAYAGRWSETKKRPDRAEAERLAKRCIDLQPDHEQSFALLEGLNHPDENAAPKASAPAIARTISLVAVLTMVIIGVVVAVVVTSIPKIPSIPNFSTSTKSPVKGRPIPIHLGAAAVKAGMTIQLDDSRLFPKDGFYCVRGDITPPAENADLKGMDLELDILDSSGAVAESDRFTAWPCSKHPGSFNFHRDNPILPNMKEARLVLQ